MCVCVCKRQYKMTNQFLLVKADFDMVSRFDLDSDLESNDATACLQKN